MFKTGIALISAAALTGAAGTAGAAAAPARTSASNGSTRGQLVSARPLATLSASAIDHQLRGLGISTASIRNGADAYRLTYRTVEPDGSATTASGLLVLPQTRRSTLSVADYEHGTQSARQDAPSEPTGNTVGSPGSSWPGAGWPRSRPTTSGSGPARDPTRTWTPALR